MDQSSIKSYLLGRLPEAERGRIDVQLLTDPNFYERLLAEEDDLIDEYVRNELTAEERKQFEQVFLALEERRDRLIFARSLHDRLAAEPVKQETKQAANQATASPVSAPWWRGFFERPLALKYVAAPVSCLRSRSF